MPTKYTVSAPDGAAKWCTALAKSISDYFNSLSAEFRDTKDGIRSVEGKFDTFSDRLLAEVKHVSDVANEAMNIATAAKASVDTLQDTVTMLQKDVYKLAVLNGGLQQENEQLS